MHYDIAAKVILSRCKETVLSDLCGLPVSTASLLDVTPQETTSLRRSDFVFRTIFEDGKERLVLLEFLSYWKNWIPIRTLEYRCRHLLQENLPVISVLLLLTPSSKATNYYLDEEVRYQFRLIKLYEFDAEEILEKGKECLYPFVPLMKNGEKLLEEAEKRIYKSDHTLEEKADFLTGMAILGGLISKEIPLQLVKRRRDIMIESAAYDIIKKEGFEEGLNRGLQQGLQQGLRESAVEMVLEVLEEKFGLLPPSIVLKIKNIEQREVLKSLLRAAIRANNFDEFKNLLKRLEE